MGGWTSETLQKLPYYKGKSGEIGSEYGRIEVYIARRKKAVHFEEKTRISEETEDEFRSPSGIRK
jgi:hypothetical protein